MKYLAPLAVVVCVGACTGGTITEPTPIPASSEKIQTKSSGGDAPAADQNGLTITGPGYTVGRITDQRINPEQLPCYWMEDIKSDLLEWVMWPVTDAVVQQAYAYDYQTGICKATLANLRTQNYDNLSVVRDGLTVYVTQKKKTRDCGRLQTDAGNLGALGLYKSDCPDDPPPPPPCTSCQCDPTKCPPPPPPPPPPPWKVDCKNGVENPTLSQSGVATFTVKAGYKFVVTLRSYTKGEAFLPQTLFADTQDRFGPGQHTMSVALPSLMSALTTKPKKGMQADLYCGRNNGADLWNVEDLTEANFAAYNAAVLAYIYK